ncbi:hypothetical protein [Pseudonocardia sp. HH130630-07]|uniref:hypothetical protein n=1 Tax=Pseudonocardia sp. HH130630-07 TaxID=1690815 RepID=UPI0008150C69|nr:hypothetical protein [Pseudonocardia sp. HH130630-07]ANY07024.1 hypothetical protein AFB00_12800 [Pseudonocardia sp. HH130630-07]
MENEQHTPAPARPAARRVIALLLISALALTAPIGLISSPGGARILGVFLLVAMALGVLVFFLHRYLRDREP